MKVTQRQRHLLVQCIEKDVPLELDELRAMAIKAVLEAWPECVRQAYREAPYLFREGKIVAEDGFELAVPLLVAPGQFLELFLCDARVEQWLGRRYREFLLKVEEVLAKRAFLRDTLTLVHVFLDSCSTWGQVLSLMPEFSVYADYCGFPAQVPAKVKSWETKPAAEAFAAGVREDLSTLGWKPRSKLKLKEW